MNLEGKGWMEVGEHWVADTGPTTEYTYHALKVEIQDQYLMK